MNTVQYNTIQLILPPLYMIGIHKRSCDEYCPCYLPLSWSPLRLTSKAIVNYYYYSTTTDIMTMMTLDQTTTRTHTVTHANQKQYLQWHSIDIVNYNDYWLQLHRQWLWSHWILLQLSVFSPDFTANTNSTYKKLNIKRGFKTKLESSFMETKTLSLKWFEWTKVWSILW